jgi:hypothetical protein
MALSAKKVLSLLSVSSLVVLGVLIAITVDANAAPSEEKGRTTSLEALGILQVAAHDLYHFDRCGDDTSCSTEHEDGKLNLSTLLEIKTSGCTAFVDCAPFSDEAIRNGGEPDRNSDSITIFTAASELGEKYLELRDKHGEEIAYEKILKIYHKKVKIAFQQTFNQPFPDPLLVGSVNNNHNSALRSVHDFLPDFVKFNGEQVSVLDQILVGEKLSKSEFKQRSLPLDGQFADTWNGCIFPGFPTSCTPDTVPLLFLDQTFAEVHTTTDFDDFMEQTSDGRYDSDEEVTQLIIEQFAMGINLP